MNESGFCSRFGSTLRMAHVGLSAQRPVVAQSMEVSGDVLPHDHDYYELCLVRAGWATHQTAQGQTTVQAGTAIVVPIGAAHAFAGSSAFSVTNVYYLSEWLLGELRDLWDQEGLVPLFLAQSLFGSTLPPVVRTFSLSEKEMAHCLDELEDITAESRRSSPSLLLLRAAMMKCLVTLSRAYVSHGGHNADLPFRAEVRAVLDATTQCLDQARPFSPDEIASNIGLSPNHITRLFRQATALSPTAYYQRLRVHKAALALLNPHVSITEVAYRLGYSDAAHLSRLFLRHQKMSPSAYRNRYVKYSGEAPSLP